MFVHQFLVIVMSLNFIMIEEGVPVLPMADMGGFLQRVSESEGGILLSLPAGVHPALELETRQQKFWPLYLSKSLNSLVKYDVHRVVILHKC